VRRDGGRVGLSCAQIHEAVPALMDVLGRDAEHLSSLTTHGATLEDVFVHLTGRHLRDA
jgi:ABC-2 type transport system ATP-binding protein